MTERELAEWMAYHRISPIGEVRHDLQAGTVAAMVGNALGGRKGKRPFKAAEFVLEASSDGAPPDQPDDRVERLAGARALYARKRRQDGGRGRS